MMHPDVLFHGTENPTMRFTLLVLALTLTLSATASAAYSPAMVNRDLQIAQQVEGPNARCTGQIGVQVAPQPIEDPSATGVLLDGYAVLPTCQIVVVDGLNPYRLCIVLNHERRHLARNDGWHSSDPNDLMYPSGPTDYAPCAEFKPAFVPPAERSPREAAADAVATGLSDCRFLYNAAPWRYYRCSNDAIARGWSVHVRVRGTPGHYSAQTINSTTQQQLR